MFKLYRFLFLVVCLLMSASCTKSDHTADDYIDGKKIINLTVLQYDPIIKKNVEAFNAQSNEYVVLVKAYIDFNLPETKRISYDNGRDLLNYDLMAGDYPDIILFDPFMPRETYINKGLFVDLYSLMESDVKFDKENYLVSAFTASERNGKLYEIFTTFHIRTLFMKTSEVENTQGWTLDEFISFIETRPNVKYPISYVTNHSFVATMSQLLFIDNKTGIVNFDFVAFQKLLEVAELFPPENPSVFDPVEILMEMRNGDPMIGEVSLSSPTNIRLWEQVYACEELTAVGYPQLNRTSSLLGESYFFPEETYAIFEKARNIEGAWKFLKFMLDTTPSQGLPVSIPLINRLIDAAKQEDIILNIYVGEKSKNNDSQQVIGTKEGYILERDNQYIAIPVGKCTDKDIEKFMYVLQSTNYIMRYNDTIENIISEEVENYFAGQINAYKTAENVKNRIGLYLSEMN